MRHEFDSDLRKHLQSILDQSQLGDWFVLYQLSKNSNSYFFRYLLKLMDSAFAAQVRYLSIYSRK